MEKIERLHRPDHGGRNEKLPGLHVDSFLLQRFGILNSMENDEADRQMPGTLLHFLPQLPRMLLGRRVDTPDSTLGYAADKYISLGRDQGDFCTPTYPHYR